MFYVLWLMDLIFPEINGLITMINKRKDKDPKDKEDKNPNKI